MSAVESWTCMWCGAIVIGGPVPMLLMCTECRAKLRGSGGARGASNAEDQSRVSPRSPDDGGQAAGQLASPGRAMVADTSRSQPAAPLSAPAPSPPLSAEGEREVERVMREVELYACAASDNFCRAPQEGYVADVRASVRGLVAEREQAYRDRDETERAFQQNILDVREAELERNESDAQFLRAALERDKAVAALRERGVHAPTCQMRKTFSAPVFWSDTDAPNCTCALRVLAEEEGSR